MRHHKEVWKFIFKLSFFPSSEIGTGRVKGFALMQRKFTRALMNADDKRFSVNKKFYVLHDKVFMNKYLLNTHKFMWRTELTSPAGNYTFKVNNRDSRKRCISSKSTWRHQNDANSVVLVSLLSTLDIFHTLSQHFYC